ncbi:hypothetical protein QQ045_029864 [Rhodiola kirilowii]
MASLIFRNRNSKRIVARACSHFRVSIPKQLAASSSECPDGWMRSMATFTRTRKPHVNVGTIGHVDHEKTTLTAQSLQRCYQKKERQKLLPLTRLIRRQKRKREELP